ncbi:MAG: hypothetical protein KDD61_06780 [Bdellovibrionales bacterium]|nr:hypothetical protein [Bdellovibrionales bacterium]
MYRLIWGIGAAIAFSFSALAAKPIVCESNGRCKFEVCGVKPGAKFQLEGSSVGGTTSKQGCARGTFNGKSGTHLKFIVDGETKGSYTVPKYTKGPGRDDSRTNNNDSRNKDNDDQARRDEELRRQKEREARERAERERQAQEREAAERALKKARNSGENAARFFANRYVETYGTLENYRFFFARSYRSTLLSQVDGDRYKDWRSYSIAYQDAEKKGLVDGGIAGERDALKLIPPKAQGEVLKRFKTAASSGNPADTSLPANIYVPYSGARSSQVQPDSLRTYVRNYNDDFHDLLRQRRFGDIEGFIIRWDLFKSDLWALELWIDNEYQGSDLSSWYGAEWAFNSWQDSYFGRSGQSERQFYRKASWEQKREFEQSFKDEFRQVIDRKWYRAITNGGTNAALWGHRDGTDKASLVSEQYASDKGRFEGYVEGYTSASISAFNQVSTEIYTEAFEKAIDDISNGIFVDTSAIQVSLASNSQVIPGASLSFELDNVINYGLKTGSILVTIQDTYINVPIDYASSTNPQPIILKDAIAVSDTASSGDFRIPVRVNGDLVAQVSVTITWESTVLSLSQWQPADPQFKIILQKIVNKIEDEWNHKIKDGGTFEGVHYREPNNLYKSDMGTYNPSTYLGKMVAALKGKTMDSQGRALLKTELKRAFGSRPGFFFSDDRGKWDSANQLIDSL